MAASTEVAVRDSSSKAGLAELQDILLGDGKLQEDIVTDPAEMQRQIMQRILDADDDSQLSGFGEATGWQELEGVPVEIHGFRWMPSSIEGAGLPVFVVVDALRMDDGSRVVLTTGAGNVLAQLVNLAKRDRFPSIWKLSIMEKATKAGFHPHALVAVEPSEATKLLAERAKADEEKSKLAEAMDGPNPLDED